MPLKPGKRNVSRNIKEMSAGPGHAKRVRQQGAKAAHRMEVAAAMREADKASPAMSINRPKRMTM